MQNSKDSLNLYRQDNYSIFMISNDNAKKFLQGQLSCDLEDIDNTKVGKGLYCDIKGRIEAILTIFKIKNNYYAKIPEDNLSPTINELNKYAKLSRVNIEECDLFICFQASQRVIDKILPSKPDITSSGLVENDFGYHYEEGQGLYSIVIHKNLEGKWLDHCTSNGIELNKHDFTSAIKILHKVPEVYKSSRGTLLPHYVRAAIPDYVSFSKGCFRGQEIIARMQYKTSNYKYDLYICEYLQEYKPKINDKVMVDGKEVGSIIRFDNENLIALACMLKSAAADNKCEINGSPIRIRKEESGT